MKIYIVEHDQGHGVKDLIGIYATKKLAQMIVKSHKYDTLQVTEYEVQNHE